MEAAGVNSTVTTTVDDGLKVFFQGDVKIYLLSLGAGLGLVNWFWGLWEGSWEGEREGYLHNKVRNS